MIELGADPHAILGAHEAKGGVVVRAFRPEARAVRVQPASGRGGADRSRGHVGGAAAERRRCRSTTSSRSTTPTGTTYTLRDPYSFLPTLGELDLHLAAEGRHEELYERLGAHVREIDGVTGTAFAVWAPNARSVAVVGDFNFWNDRLHPMRSLGSSGIWELFVPGVGAGERYKFSVHGSDGVVRLKADPVAFAAEVPPLNASVVHRPEHEWHDARVARAARALRSAAGADVDLRGASRLVAPQVGSRATASSRTSSSPTSSAPT